MSKFFDILFLVAMIIIAILINKQSGGRLFGDFIDWLKSFPKPGGKNE